MIPALGLQGDSITEEYSIDKDLEEFGVFFRSFPQPPNHRKHPWSPPSIISLFFDQVWMSLGHFILLGSQLFT